jgi:group I intron endonuclease
MPLAGVYCIKNVLTGQMYVGSSTNLASRIRSHFSSLRIGKSHNRNLQKSFNIYGERVFVWFILETTTRETVKEREQVWIDATSCLVNGFNLAKKASDNSGWKHSDEFKKKMSNERMGARNPMYGVKLSKEQIAAIVSRSLGHLHTEDSKIKMREYRRSNKGRYVGSKCGKAILNEGQVYQIKLLLSKGLSYPKVGAMFGVASGTISGIYNNTRWSHVPCRDLDNYKKSQLPHQKTRGSNNVNAKLTEEIVKEIRDIRGKSYAAIGRQYNVSDVCVSNIINNKTWKHGL